MTKDDLIKELKKHSNPKDLAGMSKFGINVNTALAVKIPILRMIAKKIGKEHSLALELWDTGIHEARILAGMIDEPEKVTNKQLETWVKDFNSWDLCDQVCMNLFENIKGPEKKVFSWCERKEEFVRRAGLALIACLAWHKKKEKDEYFLNFFPYLKKAATDDRNFVKKAVNWAIRNIGKRNKTLCQAALKLSHELLELNSKPAAWIAKDAIKELSKKF